MYWNANEIERLPPPESTAGMMPHKLMDQTGTDTSVADDSNHNSDEEQEVTNKKKRLFRMSNVKKRKSEDDGYPHEPLSLFRDTPLLQPTLPKILDVPVRLRNTSLTESRSVSMGQAGSKAKRGLSRRFQSAVDDPQHYLKHNNNVKPRPTIIIQRQAATEEEDDQPIAARVDTCFSPADEPLSHPSPESDKEHIVKAREKRRYVLQELLETEQNYVQDIGIIVNGYMEEIKHIDVPEGLRGKEKIVFGNVRAILAFHRDKFLPAIQEFHDNPQELGALFTKYEKQLRLYVTYCENKPRSEYLVTEFLPVFRRLSAKVNRKLGVQDLLIKPVQRIMKYQLLLKDILKYTERCQEPLISLHKAMDVMHAVPQAANNMMEVGRIQGFEAKIAVHGTILLQDTLHVAGFKINKSEDRKYKLRRVFLFEQIFVICDLCESPTTGHYYRFRSSIKLSELRLVERVYQEPLSFILSNTRDTTTDTYIQARTVDVKEEWTRTIRKILDKQTDFLQVLQNPLSSLSISSDGNSGKVSRSQSDRPETSAENNKYKQHRNKDNNNVRNKTIH